MAFPLLAAAGLGLGIYKAIKGSSDARNAAKAAEASAALTAEAQIKVAEIQADVSKDAAQKQLEIAQIMAAAEMAPKVSTSEVIQHRLPVEQGAAGLQSFDFAAQWAEMQAKIAELSQSQGLFPGTGAGSGTVGQSTLSSAEQVQNADDNREAEYASYEILRISRQSLEQKVKHLGIDNGTGSNPTGVKLSLDDYIESKRVKDPSGLVAQGKSLSDPLDDAETTAMAATMSMTEHEIKLVQMIMEDPQVGGNVLEAMKGDPMYANAIVWLQGRGAIDSKNQPVMSQITKIGDKINEKVQESRIMTPTSPEQVTTWTDEYNQLSGKVLDPKLVKIESIGDGVTRTTILNNDGSVVVSFLDGAVTLPNGQVMPDVDMIGSTGKDWKKLVDKFGETGSLFNTAAAPSPAKAPAAPKAPAGKSKAPSTASVPGMQGMPDLAGDPMGGAVAMDAAPSGADTTGGMAGEAAPMGNAGGDMGGMPELFNAGDPDKEHYHPPGASQTHYEGGNAVMTGGKGFGGKKGAGAKGAPAAPQGIDMEAILKDPDAVNAFIAWLQSQNGGTPAGYVGAPLKAGG